MANDKIILKAEDLDGYLTRQDLLDLERLEKMFKETMKSFDPVDEAKIIEGYDKMGHAMQEICASHPNVRVYSFVTEEGAHAEASPLVYGQRETEETHPKPSSTRVYVRHLQRQSALSCCRSSQ